MPETQRQSSIVPQIPLPLATSSSSSPSWLVTVGGTAAVAATTVAWMSYTSKRFLPLSWFRRSISTATSLSSKKKSYYLDYNGTTPIYPEVFDAMAPFLKEHFGNPSSSHLFGTEPRKAIELARTRILSHLLGVRPSDNSNDGTATSSSLDISSIWFTGCGTESDNMAIRLALLSSPPTRSPRRTKHIVTCNVEHPAIENYLRHLENGKADNTATGDKSDLVDVTVTRVPVDEEGRVSAKDVVDTITGESSSSKKNSATKQ